MKRLLLYLIGIILLPAAAQLRAQEIDFDNYDWLCPHCQQIAIDHYGGHSTVEELMLPPYKVAYWCQSSHASFFVTDELPEGAFVYDIHEVKNLKTNAYLPTSYVVNLDSLNLYAYNFDQFEQQHFGKRIYFRTPGSEHAYLVLRGWREVDGILNNDALKRYLSYPDDYFYKDQDK